MKWSKEINKMFGANRAKHFPGKKAFAIAGFQAGKPVWIVTVALKDYVEGFKCPLCGGKPDMDETCSRVTGDTFGEHGYWDDPYIETECQCASCKANWIIRKKGTEVCLDYDAPRQSDVADPYGAGPM